MNKKLVMLAVFFLLFFSAAQQLRPLIDNSSMIGSTTYYHYRSAEMISSGQTYDELSYGGRDCTYPPGFHYLLSIFLPIWPFLLPIIGVLGIFLCYLFAKQIGFNENESLFSAALLGFVPGYIYLSGHLNPRLPALLLLAFTFLLLMRKERLASVLAGLSLAAVFIIHPLVGGIGLLLGLVLFRSKLRSLAVPYAIGLFLFLLWFMPFVLGHGLPVALDFYAQYIELQTGPQFFIFENALVSDSIGLLTLLLAIYALFTLKEKKTGFLKEWLILSMLAALLLGNRLNEQLLFPVAMLAGKVFVSHWKTMAKKFRLDIISPRIWKAMFLIYIALAGVLAAGSLLYFPPDAAEYSAFAWLEQNTPADSVVFTPWFEGHWTTEIAMRKNVMDAYAEYAPDVDERYADTKKVYKGADIATAVDVLKKYDAAYLYYSSKDGDSSFCSGVPRLALYGYFDLVFQSDHVYIFRIDYDGDSKPLDMCNQNS